MKIPILNIYYLLCYSWNKLEEGKQANVSSSDYRDSIELFSRVLISGCNHLFKKGLDRNYIEVAEEYAGIKGKIDFNESLRKNIFRRGKAICQFDEFEYNILPNQILKATLKSITRIKDLDIKTKKAIWNTYNKFGNIDDIELKVSDFAKVRIHRNNMSYDFLLKVSRLIFEKIVVDEKTGEHHFKEFWGSEKDMARLFEDFVRNFYIKEQVQFKVRREDIQWDAIPLGGTTEAYLPKMQTDITLEAKDRKIIIETKYYQNALNSRFESEKYNAGNLYQIYSYLRNIETKQDHVCNNTCEGILLYPTVGYNLNETYMMGSHSVSVKTIDLSKPWNEIHSNLIALIS